MLAKSISIEKYYSEPDECPIWNFYKAHDDVSYLLVNRKKVNEVKQMYLSTILFDLQEFFSREVNAVKYKNTVSKVGNLMYLERKKIVLSAYKRGLDLLREDLKMCSIREHFSELEDGLNDWNVQVKETVSEQIATLDREIKGCSNAIAMIQSKLPKGEKELNWMQNVVLASKIWGSRIDPKVTTLSEWVEILKSIENGRGN